MDGERYRDAVNDPLDREIESLLDVEPSPEFLARVRARMAEEPAPGGWRTSWMFAVAGAGAVVILALIAWPSRQPASLMTTAIPTPRITEIVEPATTPAVTPPAATAQAVRRQSSARMAIAVPESRDRAIEIDLPDVVIAENEVRTFASWVASVRQQRFDAAVPAVPDPDTPLEVKELPPVEPLEIEPIVKLATLQAEGDRP